MATPAPEFEKKNSAAGRGAGAGGRRRGAPEGGAAGAAPEGGAPRGAGGGMGGPAGGRAGGGGGSPEWGWAAAQAERLLEGRFGPRSTTVPCRGLCCLDEG